MDLSGLLNDPQQLQILQDALWRMAIVTAVGSCLMLIIQILIAWMLAKCFESIPVKFHEVDAWHSWVTVVPCLNFAWHFLVYPKLSRSFKKYFASIGRTDVGDCGERKGLYFAISYVAGNLIPCILIYSLIVQLQYLQLVWKLRKEALDAAAKPTQA
ncbi:MAG: hypothetical protein HY291_13805 [Planctomycetes bacterium]|nr:hypothetical protein [Planctomycetota bacterium]